MSLTLGTRFGRLTVTGEQVTRRGIRSERLRKYVPVKCDCGKTAMILPHLLASGNSRSCGCLADQKRRDNIKHGGSRTRLYKVWHNIITRCYYPSCRSYKNYGVRGITVCDEWRKDFGAFRKWAAENGMSDMSRTLTVDRIDNNGPYSPGNCRAATMKQQHRNKRINLRLKAFGEVKCQAEWLEDPRCVVAKGAFSFRIKRGWDVETALTLPVLPRHLMKSMAGGKPRQPPKHHVQIRAKHAEGYSQAEIAREFGLHQSCISRIVHGRSRINYPPREPS
jgi:hypothetical protein